MRKVTLEICLKKFFFTKTGFNCAEDLDLLLTLTVRRLLKWFKNKIVKKKKTNQKELRIEKVIKRKGDETSVEMKDLMILLIVGLIKNISLYKMIYFQKHISIVKTK